MRSLMLFLFGENEFAVKMKDSTALLNLFMEYGIVYRGFRAEGDSEVVFCCSSFSSVSLRRLCAKKGIELTLRRSRGIPTAVYGHRGRIGLLIGGIMAMMLISVSDDFIWDIRVSGNEKVTYGYVVECLEKQGFGVGTNIEGIDVDKIKTAVMVEAEEISWMSINIIGTVAHVQIREVEPPNDPLPTKPANIVASMDGQIEYLEVFRGDATVRSGEAVRKGDVLISGVRDSKLGGFSVTRAHGKVFAVTSRTFKVEIPYEYEKKHYSKAQKSEISIIFFEKEIKVFKSTGNNGVFCDTIECIELLSLPGDIRIPVGLRTVSEMEYTVTVERYTADEAMEIAYYRLETLINDTVGDAQLLQKSIETEIGDSSYILTCTVKCIENIAETAEFEIELS